MKYYNKVKIEVLNKPENEEFLKSVIIDFVKPHEPTAEQIESLKTIMSDTIKDYKYTYGDNERWIVINIEVDKDTVIVEFK